ncbi:hypothetical protein L204_103909 [Cryptococcus depauperatus]
MHRPNVHNLTLDHLVPPVSSEFATSPTTPSPTTPVSFHTPPTSTPSALRRVMSEEDTRLCVSKSSETSPIVPPGYGNAPFQQSMMDYVVDPVQASLLQSARLKLSSKDQEAMRKLRSSMMEQSNSDSASSKSVSPSSPRFPPVTGLSHGRVLRTRRSTLSRVVMPEHEDETRKSEGSDEVPMKRGKSQPALSRESLESYPPFIGNADYVIAVIGHKGAGKSTVIVRALRSWGMSNPIQIYPDGSHPISSCRSQIIPGGKLKASCKVEFLEMNIGSLNLSIKPQNMWPSSVPPIAGVICCYDATQQDTLTGIRGCLERLTILNIPTVILACKSDPDEPLQVDASYGNSIGEPFNVGLIEVTTKTPEGKVKMRNAIRWLLYKLEQRQRRQHKQLTTLNIAQALTFGNNSNPSIGPGSGVTLSNATMETLASPDSDIDSAGHQLMWKRKMGVTPQSSEHVIWDKPEQIEISEKKDKIGSQEPNGVQKDMRSSNSSLEWAIQSRGNAEVEKQILGEKMARGDSGSCQANSDTPVYMSLEDLYNHLFSSIVSSRDPFFVKTFFLTFRRFCRPQDLMHEFFDRLQEVEEYAVSSDVKNWALMKLTGAIIDWTTYNLGDLACPNTQSHFLAIISLLLKHTFMAHLLSDLIAVQNSMPQAVDIDQSWSLKASSRCENATFSDPVRGAEAASDNEVLNDINQRNGSANAGKGSIGRNACSSHSISTNSLALEEVRPTQHPNHIFTEHPSESFEYSQSSSRESGSKIDIAQVNDEEAEARWGNAVNMVLRMDPKAFATELTRMQWALFMSIRPRDIFRHDLGKEIDGPVAKAISFFNHISRWTTTIILAPPKPKNRARVIESFILIAHQLRRLNNYDSLYAIISGLKETSVHRLPITQGMITVAPGVEKDWQSHLKLMDPRGGYVHYRRALQADISHGRGAIPLLTNILGLVSRLQAVRPEDIRKTDGKIQWDKFMRLGEILGTIQECQSRGAIVKGPVGTGFKQVIKDTVILSNEDALWERSQSLENGGVTMGGKMLKRLANLGF